MTLRDSHLAELKSKTFDTLVIGAGINGATSAAALASTGLQVALIDQGDFACETSMNSSNLVWGGIKYMENNEFRLVYHLCRGRNELMDAYPSQVKEVRFLTNIEKGFRHPRWYLYAGTWLYWLMGHGKTKMPQLISKNALKKLEPAISLKNSTGAFEYSDAYLYENDSRFVFGFVQKAMEYGASVSNYLRCEKAAYNEDSKLWQVDVRDMVSDETFQIQAKSVVNAAGPYLDMLNNTNNVDTEHKHLLSKGIHVIVDKVTPNNKVLTFFADDGRMFFAIPMGRRTSVGTTDTRVETPKPGIQKEDVDFVLDNINKRLNPEHQIAYEDIISVRYGVRPLAVEAANGTGEGQEFLNLSRKHILDIDNSKKHISIFGGKLTDCVNIGNEMIEEMRKLGIESKDNKKAKDGRWYGEPDKADREKFFNKANQLTSDGTLKYFQVERLWRRYGNGATQMLDKIIADKSQMEKLFDSSEFMVCELDWIKQHEMVVYLADFMRRRSRLGLTNTHEYLTESPGLKKVCELLFEDVATERYNEYIREKPAYVL